MLVCKLLHYKDRIFYLFPDLCSKNCVNCCIRVLSQKKKKKFVSFLAYICTLCLGCMQIYAQTTKTFFFPAHICANMSCAFLIFATQFLIFAAKKGAKGAKKTKKKLRVAKPLLRKKTPVIQRIFALRRACKYTLKTTQIFFAKAL